MANSSAEATGCSKGQPPGNASAGANAGTPSEAMAACVREDSIISRLPNIDVPRKASDARLLNANDHYFFLNMCSVFSLVVCVYVGRGVKQT